jgi:hypothetical protein
MKGETIFYRGFPLPPYFWGVWVALLLLSKEDRSEAIEKGCPCSKYVYVTTQQPKKRSSKNRKS